MICTDPMKLDPMLRAYAVAALWSCPYRNDTGTEDKDAPEFMDGEFGIIDIAPETLQQMSDDCQAFVKANQTNIGSVDPEQIGHDLWLSRNGHGCGFFDRPAIYGHRQADALQEAARKLGERYLWAKDGKVYME